MTTLTNINQTGVGVPLSIAQESTVQVANTPELITTTGAGSWTKPAGVTQILVECWGGGGGGGRTTINDAGGGGGGGGGYARSIIIYPSAEQSIPYTVGTGGVDGVSGDDTVWDSADVIARGGQAGEPAQSTNSEALGGSGGGFVPEISALQPNVGDVTYIGGFGGNGWAINAVSSNTAFSAGGGGAGSTGEGNSASGLADPPVGGTGASESGGNGASGTLANVNFTGLNGSNYGGGGSGAQKINGTTRIGGSGAQGLIRITTYTPTTVTPPGRQVNSV